MARVEAKVELLAHTPEPLALIYAAFRQCYHAGFVGDLWPELTADGADRARQAAFGWAAHKIFHLFFVHSAFFPRTQMV